MGKKIQFLLKKNEVYSFDHSHLKRSSGLWNSVNHIVRALWDKKELNFEIKECQDNNDIDHFVTLFKPDIVIIEALWVIPEKFRILKKLHPRVKWFVRIHSDIPFLALEGIAVEWLKGYEREKVGILVNSKQCESALKIFLKKASIDYLPNIYYSKLASPKKFNPWKSTIHVGCFGAIRPFKNQLIQAMAAIRFADEQGLKLYFCMNGTRVETGGEPVLKNIRALFEGSEHFLIETDWNDIRRFRELVRQCDLGLQVSMSETFNIVSADYLAEGVPVIGSPAISWLSRFSQAKADSVSSIVGKMLLASHSRLLTRWNQWLLKQHSKRARQEWIRWCLQ